MHDAWFKLIDYLQRYVIVGISFGSVFTVLLIVLVAVVPSRKKKTKRPPTSAQRKTEPSATTNDHLKILADYEATLNSKEREIEEKNLRIEELDKKIQKLEADINVLENIPPELAELIRTKKKNISYKIFFWGILLGIILASCISALYYITVIKGVKIF
ncbi:MAG: hypothetical protein NZ521_06315 [Flammeovirgaceae bacterium]|nr:hypothetical protein [Flammeovirgaceae bacterium]MDW8287790.1 hypothetical protein [Flammeovirgaceae bacterium]